VLNEHERVVHRLPFQGESRHRRWAPAQEGGGAVSMTPVGILGVGSRAGVFLCVSVLFSPCHLCGSSFSLAQCAHTSHSDQVRPGAPRLRHRATAPIGAAPPAPTAHSDSMPQHGGGEWVHVVSVGQRPTGRLSCGSRWESLQGLNFSQWVYDYD